MFAVLTLYFCVVIIIVLKIKNRIAQLIGQFYHTSLIIYVLLMKLVSIV